MLAPLLQARCEGRAIIFATMVSAARQLRQVIVLRHKQEAGGSLTGSS
jgi:hypothetical protein